ncbi:MAG: GGDEF domain-containing protein [Gammaproteobacteria bacterium]|nr:GGDEF domain-containing protein [Gammaproteobacteria bacterium]
MTTILQTTLKPESVLRRFSRAVAESVSHSGMIFTAESGTYKISLGRKAKHRCTFTLILEHRTLGDLVLTRGKPFLEAEAEQLEYLVSALAYPLRNSLEHRKALQASMTDPLTGIYNRSIVEHTLRREVRLARRFRNNFSLILFDIDGFKAVNDIHGHEKGDEAIIVVVNCVSESLRETDIFARYGGDEFVILLNNTGKKGAKTLATHILARAHQSDCLNFPEIPITLSIGVATLKADENEKSFLKRVDKAMYRAKGRGGDQIHVAGGKAIIRSTI